MFEVGFIKWKYFLYFFPIHCFIVLFLSTPAAKVFGYLPQWILVTLFSYVVTAAAFALAMKINWVMSDGRHEIFALILIGIVRGFAILDLGILLDLHQTKPYLLRPLNSAVNFPLWMFVLRYFIGYRREFQELFHELYVRNIRAKVDFSMGKSSTAKVSDIAKIEESVAETLSPLRENIERLVGEKMSPEILRSEVLVIQSFIEQKLRPLSHDLWRQQKLHPPKMRYMESIFRLVFKTKSQFGYAIIPSFVFGVVAASTIDSFTFAIEHSLIHLVIQILVFLVFQWVCSRTSKGLGWINLSATFLAVALPIILDDYFLTNFPHTRVHTGAELVYTGWFLLLGLTFTIAKSQSDFRRELVAIMLHEVERTSSQIQTHESRLAGQYAKYLHGDIQATLTATQMQLLQASEYEDEDAGQASIEKLAEVLRRDHHSYAISEEIAPIAKFQRIIDAWNGIALIAIDVDESNIELERLVVLSEIIEELISNAIRHGNADDISVHIAAHTETIEISFSDNGAPRKSGKRGVGTTMILSHSIKHHYSTENGINTLTFSIAK